MFPPACSGSGSGVGSGSSTGSGSGSTPTHSVILVEQTGQSILIAPATHFSTQVHSGSSVPDASRAASRSASSTTLKK